MILKFNGVQEFGRYVSGKHFVRYSYLSYDQKITDQLVGLGVHLVFDMLTVMEYLDMLYFTNANTDRGSSCLIGPVKGIECDDSLFLSKDVIIIKTYEHSFVFVATRGNHE